MKLTCTDKFRKGNPVLLTLENLPRTIAVERVNGMPQVVMVDQRRLPGELAYLRTSDWRTVIDAVKTLAVRGAPALGVAGAAVVMLRAFEFVAANEADTQAAASCQTASEDVYACLMCQRGPRATQDSEGPQNGSESLVVDDGETTKDAFGSTREALAEAVRAEGDESVVATACAEPAEPAEPAAAPAARTFTCEALDAHRTFVLDERAFDPELFSMALDFAGNLVKNARPTAVNLGWGVDRALAVARKALEEGKGPQAVADALYQCVVDLVTEDEAVNRAIGRNGANRLRSLSETKGRPLRVLTHCNAGSLATAFYGTALGVIYAAAEEGLIERVYADETRPVGQGARLTSWELAQAGVPVTLICDNMAASVMAQGLVDAVVVGADRITANGDAANKIGTLGVAVLAKHFGIPFYVAAPTSTIDAAMATGVDIPIEERDPSEVLSEPIPGVAVYNPAFDVTPADLITAVITEVD